MGKPAPNRKAIGIFFVVTGILSAGLWLANRGKPVEEPNWGQPLVMSWDVAQPEGGEKQREAEMVTVTEEKIQDRLRQELSGVTGEYGIYVYRLGAGEGYGVNELAEMPAASVMKVPVMVAAYRAMERGELEGEKLVTVTSGDKQAGTGKVDTAAVGTEFTVEELMHEMGIRSDNTAAAMLIRVVGREAIAAEMTRMGMGGSSLDKNTVTAADVGKMWKGIYEETAVSSQSKTKLLTHLKDSIYEDRISAGVPEGTVVYHKVGTGAGVWIDAGIVVPEEPSQPDVVVVILNKGVVQEEAQKTVPELVRLIWEEEVSRER